MSKDRRKARSRSSGLTEEDARLWSRVAETARPLHKGRDRVVPAGGTESDGDRPARPAAPAAKPAKPTPGRSETAARPTRPAPQLATIGRRERRQLAGGRLSVDARLDLHGLRQSEAHRALERFLAEAQARGHRHVLVVTGKGGAREDEATPFYEPRGRGVLKSLVPRWLAEPALRQFVSSFGEAHGRHGGEGALYVRLRRRTLS